MAGLCGWFSLPFEENEARSKLDAMGSHVPTHQTRVERHVGARDACMLLAVSDTACVIASESLVGAVDGFVGWRDEALARRAAQDGFAASLLDAWNRLGSDCIALLRGSFAVALHDVRNDESVLAVDNMGRRPLAYCVLPDGGVAFASSATALTALPGISDTIDPQSVYNFVYFHAVPSPRTIFADVRKVPPGRRLLVRNGNAQSDRFWQPGFGDRSRRPSDSLLDVVRGAVQRCHAPRQTGCFLSGGLDSSTVAGVLNEQTEGPAAAFTIGFAQEGYDEIGYARIATEHFGLDLHDYYITADDVESAFGEVARAYDEPFGNSSAVPTLICARLAAENGRTTLLAGDGGDELFAGNERYATQKLFGFYERLPEFLRHALLEPFFGRRSVVERGRGLQHKVRRYIEQANIPLPARTQTYNLLSTSSPATVFSDDFLATVDPEEPLRALDAEFSAEDDATPLDRLLQMDWKFTLADNDLRKVGRMCDLAGVTVRYPLLDDDVVDYSIQIPSSVKLRRLELRSFYKKATSGFLPDQIIRKSKHGFGLPFGEWLRKHDNLRSLVGDRVASLKQRGIFSEEWIDQLLAQHASEHAAYYGNFVWVLAIFEEWCRQKSLTIR